MEAIVYIRLRHRVRHPQNKTVKLRDIAEVIAPEHLQGDLLYTDIYKVRKREMPVAVVDAMIVIEKLHEQWPGIDIQFIGPAQTIVDTSSPARKPWPLFLFVWLLLFVGAGLTIMNFHEDVSMPEVHIKLYEIVTGETTEQPLIFQIPYSIGLGAGMILFFNHLFKKRLNEEPSPMEIEMFNYQQDMDQYVIVHERKEGRISDDDPHS
ncbi:stage V sporulation protein AA [Bacillus thermotolerans]|uniref:Stage V sporulation protein AA (SpoVAA) n=1 Tax=Bacillus thermotolerans TaxID=1221996 RepID=A0A0F5HYE5_BACTR|nr:stage V sporulation protein AA [Bacillus thermotolerans]KKB37915.1 Stage V sporulation protein AA (SpoVAA) [Bacillus thermotolerans]KKB38399.1 Stage V sporulation protein AA (SpoVAA) [Bacillus thermotolerans]